ncbi:MAG: hypothetical protein JWR15_1617 [Prosthecobacter sp.]|nr:hypothetical protein [Prosthecobacter sp.]
MNTRVLLLLLFMLVPAAAMCVWFGHRAPVPKPLTVAKTTPATAPVISPTKENASIAAAAEPRHYRPKPVTAEVRRMVDGFIRRYKDASPEVLMKSQEMASMTERFEHMMDTPEFQSEMEKRMAAIKAAKGQEHGMLTIGTGKPEEPESRAWLEAMFSDDAGLLQDYILNKLDGAIFEFAFDPTLESAGNGVTVKGAPASAPPANKLPD